MSRLFCRNCKYFKPDLTWLSTKFSINNGFCVHPKNASYNLVSGKPKFIEAGQARMDEKNCGKIGKFFEHPKYGFLKTLSNNILYFPVIPVVGIYLWSVSCPRAESQTS